jgi:Protein of unknown function (DUF4031)
MFYVDELSNKNRPGFATRAHEWNWCHLTTDGSLDDLHELARVAGIDFAHYHGPGALTPIRGFIPYYDITPGQRLALVRGGAEEVDSKTILRTVAV